MSREAPLRDSSQNWRSTCSEGVRVAMRDGRRPGTARDPFRWTSFLWGIRCPDRWPTHRRGARAATSLRSSRGAGAVRLILDQGKTVDAAARDLI